MRRETAFAPPDECERPVDGPSRMPRSILAGRACAMWITPVVSFPHTGCGRICGRVLRCLPRWLGRRPCLDFCRTASWVSAGPGSAEPASALVPDVKCFSEVGSSGDPPARVATLPNTGIRATGALAAGEALSLWADRCPALLGARGRVLGGGARLEGLEPPLRFCRSLAGRLPWGNHRLFAVRCRCRPAVPGGESLVGGGQAGDGFWTEVPLGCETKIGGALRIARQIR